MNFVLSNFFGIIIKFSVMKLIQWKTVIWRFVYFKEHWSSQACQRFWQNLTEW